MNLLLMSNKELHELKDEILKDIDETINPVLRDHLDNLLEEVLTVLENRKAI